MTALFARGKAAKLPFLKKQEIPVLFLKHKPDHGNKEKEMENYIGLFTAGSTFSPLENFLIVLSSTSTQYCFFPL